MQSVPAVAGCEDDGVSSDASNRHARCTRAGVDRSGDVVVAGHGVVGGEGEVEHQVAVQCVQWEELATEATDDTRYQRETEPLFLPVGYDGSQTGDERGYAVCTLVKSSGLSSSLYTIRCTPDRIERVVEVDGTRECANTTPYFLHYHGRTRTIALNHCLRNDALRTI